MASGLSRVMGTPYRLIPRDCQGHLCRQDERAEEGRGGLWGTGHWAASWALAHRKDTHTAQRSAHSLPHGRPLPVPRAPDSLLPASRRSPPSTAQGQARPQAVQATTPLDLICSREVWAIGPFIPVGAPVPWKHLWADESIWASWALGQGFLERRRAEYPLAWPWVPLRRR